MNNRDEPEQAGAADGKSAVRRYTRYSIAAVIAGGLAVSAVIHAFTGAELDRVFHELIEREKAETANQAEGIDQALTQV